MNNKQLGFSLLILLLLIIGSFYWGISSGKKKSNTLIAERDDEILQLKSDIQNLRLTPPHNNIQ